MAPETPEIQEIQETWECALVCANAREVELRVYPDAVAKLKDARVSVAGFDRLFEQPRKIFHFFGCRAYIWMEVMMRLTALLSAFSVFSGLSVLSVFGAGCSGLSIEPDPGSVPLQAENNPAFHARLREVAAG